MNGSERDSGIIQRAVEDIFQRIQTVVQPPPTSTSVFLFNFIVIFSVDALSGEYILHDFFNWIFQMSDREFLIRISYMEIYNEEINDLFAVENQKLPIHESLEVCNW